MFTTYLPYAFLIAQINPANGWFRTPFFTMKITKKKRNQDVYLRFGRFAAGLLHVLHALHG
jgi:hypothetical protein